jgi:hypothetical protein
MARSGTTVLFEGIATHPALGWINYHFERFPRRPSLAGLARLCDWSFAFRKSMQPSGVKRSFLERFRDGPAEGYPVWGHYGTPEFLTDYLFGRAATAKERESLRSMFGTLLSWQHKQRLILKLTGPARIEFIQSLFPDARFVHIVRDGRAVAASLMQVDFWRDSHRMARLAWSGPNDAEILEQWERSGGSPLVLAALQWQSVVNLAVDEKERCGAEWLQIRYPDFLTDPAQSIDRIFDFAELPRSNRAIRFVERRAGLPHGDTRFSERLSPKEWAQLTDLLGPTLDRFGFDR